jgi:hypothetical protein
LTEPVLPIPDGFTEKDCTFLTVGTEDKCYGRGCTPEIITDVATDKIMTMPFKGKGTQYYAGGAYGVWAAKPVMSEEDIEKKKRQYKLSA